MGSPWPAFRGRSGTGRATGFGHRAAWTERKKKREEGGEARSAARAPFFLFLSRSPRTPPHPHPHTFPITQWAASVTSRPPTGTAWPRTWPTPGKTGSGCVLVAGGANAWRLASGASPPSGAACAHAGGGHTHTHAHSQACAGMGGRMWSVAAWPPGRRAGQALVFFFLFGDG